MLWTSIVTVQDLRTIPVTGGVLPVFGIFWMVVYAAVS